MGKGCRAHHGEVAGSPVDIQFAQQLAGQGHLVRGSIVGHVQPLHVLYQGLLVVLLPEQVIALSEQVLHQLEQEGLCREGAQIQGCSMLPQHRDSLSLSRHHLPPHLARQLSLTSYSSCFRGRVDLAGKERDMGMAEHTAATLGRPGWS